MIWLVKPTHSIPKYHGWGIIAILFAGGSWVLDLYQVRSKRRLKPLWTILVTCHKWFRKSINPVELYKNSVGPPF